MNLDFDKIWASDTSPDYPSDTQTKRGLSYLGTEPPTFDLHDAIFQRLDKKDQWLYDQVRLACERFGQNVSESVAGASRDTMANAITNALLTQRKADEGGYGIVRMADYYQTQAGSEYNLAVSPAHLAEYVATKNTWDNTLNKPQTATRWPGWSEVTGKPTFGSAAWVDTSAFDPAGAASERVARDHISAAGFVGGDGADPYFRHDDGTVVHLATQWKTDSAINGIKKELGTASAKNTEDFDPAGAASAAKNEAINNSVVRDSSRRAGFISGNKYAPYIEFHDSNGATEVVEIARQAYLSEQLGKLGSMSRQNSDTVNISGGTIKAGEITSTSNGATYRLINGTDATSYGSFWRMDPYHLHLCLTNAGDSAGGYRDKGIPISVLLSDGTIKLNNSTEVHGGLEIYNGGGTPFIDFHFGGNTGDYTSRIIETASGQLSIYGAMSWTKPRQTLDNLGFDVNKQAKGHQQIGTDGIIIQWGPWSSPARGAGQWVGFDTPFPNGCMGVVVGVTNAASQMSGCKSYNNGGFIATTGNEDPLARSGWYIAIGW